jgi:hypothetical protein
MSDQLIREQTKDIPAPEFREAAFVKSPKPGDATDDGRAIVRTRGEVWGVFTVRV